LTQEEQEANELLQQEWDSSSDQKIVKFSLMIGKAILNLETKFSRLETTNDKLMDTFDAEGDSKAASECQ